eukprot:2984309-Amphidinium_carterae.1
MISGGALDMKVLSAIHHEALSATSAEQITADGITDVFGQCWWSMGLSLSTLLSTFSHDMHAYEAACLKTRTVEASIDTCTPIMTMVQLECWLRARAPPMQAAKVVLEECLSSVVAECAVLEHK